MTCLKEVSVRRKDAEGEWKKGKPPSYRQEVPLGPGADKLIGDLPYEI